LNVSVYNDESVFERIGDRWNALLRESTSDLVFLTLEWQSTWWAAYKPGDLWVIVIEDGDTLVGIAPWFVQSTDTGRVVRTIGCVDVTDYMDIIVRDPYAEVVYRELARQLLENSCYDRINLCNIRESSITCDRFTSVLNESGFDARLVPQEVCPVIDLPSDWETYLNRLDKKQRHEIRRKIRRAESEADIQYVVAGRDQPLTELVEPFLNLMRTSQPTKAEFLSVPANEQFFRAILKQGYDHGWLRLSMLFADGVPASAYCDFDYNNQMLVYNSGLDPNVQGHLSTGIVLLAYNIREAIEAGRTLFDFLRGNESYKYRMGARETQVFKLLATRAGSPPVSGD
jgi:CelD/BcsL family acetyltransferase involved in cellulose biosynthesis